VPLGPWPRGLASGTLGRHISTGLTFPPHIRHETHFCLGGSTRSVVVGLRRAARTAIVLASPSPRREVRERHHHLTAPPALPFHTFAPSQPPAARGRRTREMAFRLSRRSWCRFSHAPPTLSAFGEPANQRHASCNEWASSVLASRAQLSRRFADSPRRAPPASAPLTPEHSCGTRTAVCAITPSRFHRRQSVTDRESLLCTRRGNRRAGRPARRSCPGEARKASRVLWARCHSAWIITTNPR